MSKINKIAPQQTRTHTINMMSQAEPEPVCCQSRSDVQRNQRAGVGTLGETHKQNTTFTIYILYITPAHTHQRLRCVKLTEVAVVSAGAGLCRCRPIVWTRRALSFSERFAQVGAARARHTRAVNLQAMAGRAGGCKQQVRADMMGTRLTSFLSTLV